MVIVLFSLSDLVSGLFAAHLVMRKTTPVFLFFLLWRALLGGHLLPEGGVALTSYSVTRASTHQAAQPVNKRSTAPTPSSDGRNPSAPSVRTVRLNAVDIPGSPDSWLPRQKILVVICKQRASLHRTSDLEALVVIGHQTACLYVRLDGHRLVFLSS